MDAHGIDVHVLSLTALGLQVDIDPTTAIANARFANDQLTEMIAAHPTYFRGFAAVPLQDPQAAIVESRRTVRELRFCGALIHSC